MDEKLKEAVQYVTEIVEGVEPEDVRRISDYLIAAIVIVCIGQDAIKTLDDDMIKGICKCSNVAYYLGDKLGM